MSKLIKRKDGSYSKRGLWDNIRENKGSGKEPTKEMLKQESKIKKEENMNSMYKKGGKTSKSKVMKEARKEGESFMEENKEINFEAPGVKPPMKYMMGGLETGMQANARQNQAEGKATMAGKKKMYKTGGVKKYEDGGQKPGDPLKATADSTEYFKGKKEMYSKMAGLQNQFYGMTDKTKASIENSKQAAKDEVRQWKKGKFGYDENGYSIDLKDQVLLERAKKMGHDTIEEYRNSNWGYGKDKKMTGGVKKYRTGGAKTMEPGGGGRFAAMVGKLKSKGKSEESAEAIAASAGRKKYGKSKFQSMAAAGKKKMMGGKKC